jgi:hypothetical protein
MITNISSKLVEGDPLDPCETDLIVQQGYLAVGTKVPGIWRVLTGNDTESLVIRVLYRYELG